MSDFTVLLDRIGHRDLRPQARALQEIYERRLCAGTAATKAWQEPTSIVLHTFATEQDDLQVHVSDNGFAIVKGLAFNVTNRTPVSPVDLLSRLDRGDEVFAGVEGAFAAMVCSLKDQLFVAFNDPFSVQNLYVGDFEGVLAVTTLSLPLAKALSLTLDRHSVQMFLSAGSIITPQSMFRGLSRLSIGEYASGGFGQTLSIGRAWRPDLTIAHEKQSDSGRRIGDALVVAIQDIARSRSPILADLTGGYDSRLIVAALSRSGADFALTVNGADADPDVLAATAAATHCGWPITHFDPTHPLDRSDRSTSAPRARVPHGW